MHKIGADASNIELIGGSDAGTLELIVKANLYRIDHFILRASRRLPTKVGKHSANATLNDQISPIIPQFNCRGPYPGAQILA